MASLKKYETIYGALVGAIPSLIFQIFPSDTMIPLSWFISIITVLLIATWFCFASRMHALSDLNDAKEKMIKMTDYKSIVLHITNLDWQEKKMKFNCNVDTNILSKGQCVAIYYKKNDFNYLCGIGHITKYDLQMKIAEARIMPLKSSEFDGEQFPSKENTHVSPMVDYDILDVFIKNYGRTSDE